MCYLSLLLLRDLYGEDKDVQRYLGSVPGFHGRPRGVLREDFGQEVGGIDKSETK